MDSALTTPVNPPKPSNSEKPIGYFLLVLGLLIIAAATFFAISVLSGKTAPFKAFDVEAPAINLPQVPLSDDQLQQFPGGINLGTQSEMKLFPDEVFSRLLNTSVFYLAMMFLASSGAKVADIGVKLIKEYKFIQK